MAYVRSFPEDNLLVTAEFTGQTGITTKSSEYILRTGSRSGSKGVDWRAKIRAGQQAGTAYSLDRAKVLVAEPVFCQIRYEPKIAPNGVKYSQTARGFVQVLTSCEHLPISSTSVENTALSKIHKRIREQTSHFNGQSFVGELGDTIRMLKRPMSSLRDKVNEHLSLLEKRKKGVRGRNRRERQKSWKDVIASTWLETQFGIAPLISDTKAIAESIARFETNPPRRTLVEAVARQSTGATSAGDPVTITSGFYAIVRNNNQRKTEVSCKYRAGMEISTMADFSSTTRLRETLGFTTENFVPALWEVLPWSWLADYFSNAGNILEAMTTDTTNVKWITKTVRRETTWERKLRCDLALTSARLDSFGFKLVQPSVEDLGTFTLLRRTFDRTLPLSLGVPSLEFSIPGVDSKRWLNILAVWAQRRKTVEAF